MSVNYLGIALKYPVELSNGKPVTATGKDVIQQSIVDILETPIGSKFFLPEYGSRVKQLLFEPNDDVLEDLMTLFIYEALQVWEKRVQFAGVRFSRFGTHTNCEISYRILSSNEVDSFIYPFYKSLKY